MCIVSPEFEVKPLNGVITVGLGKPVVDGDLVAAVVVRQDQFGAVSRDTDVARINVRTKADDVARIVPCAKGDDNNGDALIF